MRADLATALATKKVHVASLGEAWLALVWWVPFHLVRQPALWVLAAGGGLLVWAADALIVSQALPELSAWPALGWTALGAAVAYLLLTTVASFVVTGARHWVLFSDAEHTAVIGARVRQDAGRTSVIVNNHVARRIGAGTGRRLRIEMGQGLREFMVSHPDASLRFTAQNDRLARAYLDDLGEALPVSEGWHHHVVGRRASISREPSRHRAETRRGGSAKTP